MGGSDNKVDGLASQPRRYRVPGQPLLNRHQVGGVSYSPDGLFAQQEREPIRGRPAVRGKKTYGGRPGQRVEEQGTWASRTQKHSEAGYGRPVDRGAWTAKTVNRPQQQPAHPQYANYWAPLMRKRHTMPHSAQPQHTNYWAPRTRKRHQQEHRPQRPTESSNPTQHAKGRTGDCPGPRKGATTRRNVTQGGSVEIFRFALFRRRPKCPHKTEWVGGTSMHPPPLGEHDAKPGHDQFLVPKHEPQPPCGSPLPLLLGRDRTQPRLSTTPHPRRFLRQRLMSLPAKTLLCQFFGVLNPHIPTTTTPILTGPWHTVVLTKLITHSLTVLCRSLLHKHASPHTHPLVDQHPCVVPMGG